MKLFRSIFDQNRNKTKVTIDLKETGKVSNNLKQEGRSSSLVRTLALRAKGRRFKSGPAHHHGFLFEQKVNTLPLPSGTLRFKLSHSLHVEKVYFFRAASVNPAYLVSNSDSM
jgi:hypothetical protein